jgi:membrane protein implicated in regulation of membrane protease activity
MESLTLINIATVILIGTFFICTVLIIMLSDTRLEWKISRTMITVFAVLSLWALIRYITRLDKSNAFDLLIIVFNIGLLGIGYYTSRDIKK